MLDKSDMLFKGIKAVQKYMEINKGLHRHWGQQATGNRETQTGICKRSNHRGSSAQGNVSKRCWESHCIRDLRQGNQGRSAAISRQVLSSPTLPPWHSSANTWPLVCRWLPKTDRWRFGNQRAENVVSSNRCDLQGGHCRVLRRLQRELARKTSDGRSNDGYSAVRRKLSAGKEQQRTACFCKSRCSALWGNCMYPLRTLCSCLPDGIDAIADRNRIQDEKTSMSSKRSR